MQDDSNPLNQDEISSSEKEFSFKDIFMAIWTNRFLVIIFPILVGSITAIYNLTLPDVYRAEVILATADSKTQNPSTASSGLAAMAGISLPSGTDNKTFIAIETVKSKKFISEFLIRHEALPALMAPISWDSKEDILEVGEYHGSIQQATKQWKTIFYVEKLSQVQPFVLMTITHISPTQARDWLVAIVEDLNKSLKEIR